MTHLHTFAALSQAQIEFLEPIAPSIDQLKLLKNTTKLRVSVEPRFFSKRRLRKTFPTLVWIMLLLRSRFTNRRSKGISLCSTIST
jgi:hypothetical protein